MYPSLRIYTHVIEAIILRTDPGEDGEKRAEDGCSNGAVTKAGDGIVTDTPLVDHRTERYQVSHSPET